MIWYIFVSAILLYFFELVGRYILYKLKINNFRCCFGIGFIIFLAYSYITTSLITALNGSFYLLCIIYAIFFVVFLVLIIVNREKISFKIDVVNLITLILFELFMLLYAYNTTLGELNGFDTTFYLNLVTSNVKSNHLNFSYYDNASVLTTISTQYSFQSYYYIASFFSFVFAKLINFFHTTYYQTVYIWVFQILFNGLFCSLIINSLEIIKLKNKFIISIIIYIFFVLVFGRIYYFNVLGFYGNTYRIIMVGYSTLVLYLLLKNEINDGLVKLFVCSLLASASVSSSAVFIDVFILFAAYFVLCKKYKSILRYYGFVLLFLLTNLLTVSLGLNIFLSLLIAITVSGFLLVFGEKINRYLSKKKILLIILGASVAFMVVSSYTVTNNFFDYDSFFVNISEWADMTINYFNINSLTYLKYLKIFILLLIATSVLSINKEPFIIFILILFVCIFNPFCSGILFKLLRVYYRAFDIIVNPFTIILYIGLILEYFRNNVICEILVYVLIIFVSIQNHPLQPLYYHSSFVPNNNVPENMTSNYNNEFKMQQNEMECIEMIYNDSVYRNIDTPYIITANLLTQSYIPSGRFLYNRYEYSGCPYNTEAEKQLFAIFFPERYKGEKAKGIDADYNNIKRYINEAHIDYLVVDKTKEYYDEKKNEYSFVYYKVLEDYYPMFENDRYLVFCCSQQ